MLDDQTFELLTKMYSEFRNEFSKVDKKFELLDGRLDKLDNRLEIVEDNLGNVMQRLDSVEGHIVRLENKQSIDSKALFDGYKLTYENTVEIKREISDMKEILDNHEIKLHKVK